MRRLRLEFRGLRWTPRAYLLADVAGLLGLLAVGYLITLMVFPWCAS